MVTGNFRIAFESLKASKFRSFLTMLGIIIGVVSVVTVVSIGEGVKQQISKQITQMGSDIITVRGGKPVTRDESGAVNGLNVMGAFSTNQLTESDIVTAKDTPGVAQAVPLSYVTAEPKVGDRVFNDSFVLGTTSELPTVLNQKIKYGGFFDSSDESKNVAVIGSNLSDKLFGESVPVGSSVTIKGENFIVRGIFDEFSSTNFIPNSDYDNAIFIPQTIAKKLSGGQLAVEQILVKPTDAGTVSKVREALTQRLLNVRAGQDDFTVLEQKDLLALAGSMLTILTTVIGAIAAISLIVGGIGIMNVMLVSVTERMHEIGVRKSVGATNSQILHQFIIESGVISFVGGVVGVVFSLIVNGVLRIFTDLQPVLTLPVTVIAVGVSVLVGTLFGVAPALKAARKDPIDALRRV